MLQFSLQPLTKFWIMGRRIFTRLLPFFPALHIMYWEASFIMLFCTFLLCKLCATASLTNVQWLLENSFKTFHSSLVESCNKVFYLGGKKESNKQTKVRCVINPNTDEDSLHLFVKLDLSSSSELSNFHRRKHCPKDRGWLFLRSLGDWTGIQGIRISDGTWKIE